MCFVVVFQDCLIICMYLIAYKKRVSSNNFPEQCKMGSMFPDDIDNIICVVLMRVSDVQALEKLNCNIISHFIVCLRSSEAKM